MEITRTTQITDGLDSITWTLTDGTETIGYLTAHTSGLILNVEVEEAHQGEGHARRLYEHADADHGLYHVPAWGRTHEGNCFAEAMGGDTMTDEQACEILGLDVDEMTGAAWAA